MTYVECDRCGHRERIEDIHDTPNTKKLVVWKDVGSGGVHNIAHDVAYDLCAGCMRNVTRKIAEFVKTPPKEIGLDS